MAQITQLRPRRPVALPPPDMLLEVQWDAMQGMFIPRLEVANDRAGAAVRVDRRAPARPLGPLNIAPEDADMLMRGLAGWCAGIVLVALTAGWRP